MSPNLSSLQSMLGKVFEPLMDKDVVEISLNPSLDVYVEYFGADAILHSRMERDIAERFIRYCASQTDGSITKENPILSARIPDLGHRIEALLPPVVDAPSFSIRRHSDRVIPLSDFVSDERARRYIENAIETKKSIIVAGSTGSGKTTLTNGCLDHLGKTDPNTRMVILEDTPEIKPSLKNSIHLRTSHSVDMDRLLTSTLRLAPDRIVVGEVRNGAVLMTLLKAWNTGHPGGVTTLHANSADEVLSRMRVLSSEVSVSDQSEFIMSALDMIIFVARGNNHPEIQKILSINKSKPTPIVEQIYEHN
jgi:P-type conjugative transfer ATPase TrbB